MSWNYRVMKKKNKSGEYEFGIYEVYYDETGKVISWTTESMTPVCASEADLDYEINIMRRAFEQETLLYTED